MARQPATRPPTPRRLAGTRAARLVVTGSLLGALAAGCAPASPGTGAPVASRPGAPVQAVVYRTATCDCCEGHVEHLRAAGFDVRSVVVEDLNARKTELGVPLELGSCHTTVVEGYFVEGHMPADVVYELLDERPDIDGIALPGMPAGSPGMPGPKQEQFVVFAVDGDDTTVFATR